MRVIREEFNAEYRGVVIDDQRLFEDVRDYVGAFNPELADRVEYYDPTAEGLPLFERYHIHEQLHKALDRKVWLPSRRVADHRAHRGADGDRRQHRQERRHVATSRRRSSTTTSRRPTRSPGSCACATSAASSSSTSSTWRSGRTASKVVDAFRDALARDKTRTQVFDISELGLVEMTRKRIGEGLLDELRRPVPELRGPRRGRSTTPCSE